MLSSRWRWTFVSVLLAAPLAVWGLVSAAVSAVWRWFEPAFRPDQFSDFNDDGMRLAFPGLPLDAGLQHSLRHEAGFHQYGAARKT